ncbi:MAG: galactose-1-phosphate uridylyltransferase [Fimbriimonadales bacterium]
MPEIRIDIITEERVIVATERSRRPHDFKKADTPAAPIPEYLPNCPFCVGNESMTPPEVDAFREVGSAPDTPGWWVRTVPNKFPALAPDSDDTPSAAGIYTRTGGYGIHEVIIETPKHNETPVVAPARQWREVVRMYQRRLQVLSQNERLKTVLIFRNEGKPAGASLEHPHSQLVGLPFVPPVYQRHIEGVTCYQSRHGRHPFEAILEQEIREGTRVVNQTERFVVYAPFASRAPYELAIVPTTPALQLATMDADTLAVFADVLQDALRRLDAALGNPPYNYMLFAAPIGYDGTFWEYVRIAPRLSIDAGFELGAGVGINITAPEDAARYLREAFTASA